MSEKEPATEQDGGTGFGDAWDDLEAAEGQLSKDAPPSADDDKDPDAPPADEDSSAQVEAPADPPLASEETVDPWKDAPPALREAHERAVNEAKEDARRHAGRAAAAQRELDTFRAQFADKRDASAAPKEGEEATDREKRREQLREEYPDLAPDILDDMQAQEERIARLEAVANSVEDARDEQFVEEQERVLAQAHPDWHASVRTDDFKEYALGLPPPMQAILRDNANAIKDGASIAFILDGFRASKANEENPAAKRAAERRAEQIEGARDARTAAPPTKKGQADDFEGAWEEFEEKDRRAAGRR